jgi:hypothetical protein
MKNGNVATQTAINTVEDKIAWVGSYWLKTSQFN